MSIKQNTKNLINSFSPEIILVGVTKYSNRKEAEEAIEAGLTHIGENRVESIEKIKGLKAKKHFIGNIQSNKIKDIVENFDIVESVSSLKHLKKIEEVSKNPKEVLLQLKISSDKNKNGLEEKELGLILEESRKLSKVKVLGFMMMASKTENKRAIRAEFRHAKEIFDRYKKEYNLKYLSMGMSKDYQIAIEEGSNLVRVGSKIFKD